MRRILIMLLLACSLSLAIPASAQTTVSRYVYAITDWKSTRLVFIDPLQPSDPPQTLYLDLRVPSQFPFKSIPSPNGQWLLLYGTIKDYNSVILLYDLASGETQEINGAILEGTANEFTGEAQDAVWSPDSQRIAFVLTNSAPDDRLSTDVFIYDLRERSLARLTPDDFRNHRVAWSPDSTRIVTFTDNCDFSSSFTCQNRVEVFDILSRSLVDALDYTPIANVGGLYDTACELAWSPTGRYISFVVGCKTTMFGSEVYVWDTISQNLEQVTRFTEDHESNHWPNYVFTTYSNAWVDAQTLLIGAHVTRNVNPTYEQSATLSYDVSDGTTTILSRNAAEFLTVNPQSGEIAFRSIHTFHRFLVCGYHPARAYINIGVFDEGTLDTRVSAMDGGDLSWQPDGDILAYAFYGGYGLKTIMFVNRTDGSILAHRVSPRRTLSGAYPIGWVLVDPTLISGDTP